MSTFPEAWQPRRFNSIRFGNAMDVVAPDGRGLRYDASGKSRNKIPGRGGI